MPGRSFIGLGLLGLGLLMPGTSGTALAMDHGARGWLTGRIRPAGGRLVVDTVSAARPGIRVVRAGDGTAASRGSRGTTRRALAPADGAGRSFCAGIGGYRLGAHLDNVYACGPATGTPDEFDTVGFQCVEMTARFVWVVYGDAVTDVPDGRDFVSVAHSELGTPVETPGVGVLPTVGDVVSLWGGPDALASGHTAVVTSVNVDSAGDGAIGIMEENALSSGWDRINVSNWRETYGDPNWDGGAYYYNHISWLALRAGSPPPVASIQYSVRGLGAGSTVSAINDRGAVAGVIRHPQVGASVAEQPFVFGAGKWTYPGSPSPAVRIVGLNNRGALAAWAPRPEVGASAYTTHVKRHAQWRRLPLPSAAVDAGGATSVDPQGDVTGWVTSENGADLTTGVIWTHRHNSYSVQTLQPSAPSYRPVVAQTDHWGDAIGGEMVGGGKMVPVVWAPWGTAFPLPSLDPAGRYGHARAMRVSVDGTTRTLTVVGSSDGVTGVPEACEWTVTIRPHWLWYSAPQSLVPAGAPGPSSAVGINATGWVVGNMGSQGASNRAFLWRPGAGMVDLQTLIAPASGWVVLDVAGINGAGQIIGQGYNQNVPDLVRARGVLLDPHA